MDTSFEFVDNNVLDERRMRKLIRSHVMKGKNTGKKRPPKRLQKGADNGGDPSAPTGNSRWEVKDSRARQVAKIDQPVAAIRGLVGIEFSSIAFPLEVTPHMGHLIHAFFSVIGQELYPPEFCRSIDFMKTVWFQYMVLDEAFFHCTLAIAAASLDHLLGRETDSPEVFSHLSRTFRLINQRLSSIMPASDSTIGAVVSLAVYNHMRKDVEESRIHMDGLHRMIELRGGLFQLSNNWPLAQKVCRVDIGLALHQGSPPRFHRDEMHLFSFHPVVVGNIAYGDVSSLPTVFRHPDLQHIALDIMNTTSMLNCDSSRYPILGLEGFQEILISVCYRLLRLHPLCGPRPVQWLEDACHLGLTAFGASLLLQFGRHRFSRYDCLSERLGTCLRTIQVDGPQDAPVLLWLLFLGGVTFLGEADDPWLKIKARATARLLGINTWAGVNNLLTTFPWVNSLHGDPGKALWEASFAMDCED